MNIQQKGIILLIHSALTGEKHTLPDGFDFIKAYKLGVSHRIVPLIYYGIVNCGITLDNALNEKFFSKTCTAIAVIQKQNFFLNVITKEFKENNLDFMLLKGTVIRNLYPKPEMRTMGDADVLINYGQYSKMPPILSKIGLNFVKENVNEIVWDNHPFYLELHRYLVAPHHKDYFRYFGDGWRFAKQKTESEYVMSDEDYYIYLFAHLTKHYRTSGIGIKHLVDVWVYLNAKDKLNMEYINTELEKLRLAEFHKNVVKTVKCWFDGEKEDDITKTITDRVFTSGSFGTAESKAKSDSVKLRKNSVIKNVRLARFLNALFPSYNGMCILYPILKKAPVFLPFMWIWRLISKLFNNKNVKKKLENINSATLDGVDEFEQQLNLVGLDLKFNK